MSKSQLKTYYETLHYPILTRLFLRSLILNGHGLAKAARGIGVSKKEARKMLLDPVSFNDPMIGLFKDWLAGRIKIRPAEKKGPTVSKIFSDAKRAEAETRTRQKRLKARQLKNSPSKYALKLRAARKAGTRTDPIGARSFTAKRFHPRLSWKGPQSQVYDHTSQESD